MSRKFKRWDSAEHLKTREDMAAYLEACLEEDDPELVTHALGVISTGARAWPRQFTRSSGRSASNSTRHEGINRRQQKGRGEIPGL